MRHPHLRYALTTIMAAWFAGQPTAHAQTPPIEITKLLAEDGVPQQSIAEAVAIDGDRIVLGARLDDQQGINAGAAYVFVNNGGIWGQEAKLFSNLPDPNDVFGLDVGVSGDTIVVGAPGDDDTADSAGAAYVFVRSGTAWFQQAKLTASDGSETAFFGGSVDIEGDWILVTAPSDDASGVNAGAAYAFERSGTNWVERAVLRPAAIAPGDAFGTAVDMGDNRAVIGATGVGPRGGAFLFGRVGTAWIEGPLLQNGLTGTQQFGTSVGISGDVVVVGDPEYDNGSGSSHGRAFVFERFGTNWSPTSTLSGTNTSFARFGSSVGVSGGAIVVGEKGVSRAYHVTKPAGAWVSTLVLSGETSLSDQFGAGIAVSDNCFVVGAPLHGHQGTNSGAAMVFSLEPTPLPSFCFGDGGDQMGCKDCPCGNNAPVGTRAGCTNSTGLTCSLRPRGIPSVSSDSLRFDVEGANILTFALLASGDDRLPVNGVCPPGSGTIAAAAPFDGLRCVGTSFKRHGTRATDFNGSTVTPWGPPAGPVGGLIAQGGFSVGQSRHFQVIYREFNTLGCGTGLNTSSAVTATFVP